MKKIERLQAHIKKLQLGGTLDEEGLLSGKYGLSAAIQAKSLKARLEGTDVSRSQLDRESYEQRMREVQFGSSLEPLKPDELLKNPGKINIESTSVGSNGEVLVKAINDVTGEETVSGNMPELQETSIEKERKGLSDKGKAAIGVGSTIAVEALNAADNALMGDKNFSALSQGIDNAVHGVSGALMKSGNPWAQLAGAALEGINFITKAGGRTVPGFDVNINNSGYGNMGHMESESGRIWNNMDKKLAKRNEQARMALAALNVSQEQEYLQEARANSVTNVLQLNQIALAGGIDPSLLAS